MCLDDCPPPPLPLAPLLAPSASPSPHPSPSPASPADPMGRDRAWKTSFPEHLRRSRSRKQGSIYGGWAGGHPSSGPDSGSRPKLAGRTQNPTIGLLFPSNALRRQFLACFDIFFRLPSAPRYHFFLVDRAGNIFRTGALPAKTGAIVCCLGGGQGGNMDCAVFAVFMLWVFLQFFAVQFLTGLCAGSPPRWAVEGTVQPTPRLPSSSNPARKPKWQKKLSQKSKELAQGRGRGWGHLRIVVRQGSAERGGHPRGPWLRLGSTHHGDSHRGG